MIKIRKNKSSKTVFTATHRKAKYVGTHPHIADQEGLYYYNTAQESYIFRPAGDAKSDWYRVNKENIIDLE